MAFGFAVLHQAQRQGQQDPDKRNPLGGCRQNLIQTAVLILAQIRIGSAGQRAGQAGFLAGLHENDDDQRKAANRLQNNQNSF